MSRLVIRPYYSRAFGSEWAVIPLAWLDERGLQDRSQDARIIAHLDGLPPSKVTRFKTHDDAERYMRSVTKEES